MGFSTIQNNPIALTNRDIDYLYKIAVKKSGTLALSATGLAYAYFINPYSTVTIMTTIATAIFSYDNVNILKNIRAIRIDPQKEQVFYDKGRVDIERLNSALCKGTILPFY